MAINGVKTVEISEIVEFVSRLAALSATYSNVAATVPEGSSKLTAYAIIAKGVVPELCDIIIATERDVKD